MVKIETRTVRPGYLVCLKTSVSGNVSYRKRDLEFSATFKKWETEKYVLDPVEHEAATQLRNRCVTLIRACCSNTSFGYMVPVDGMSRLSQAVTEVDNLTREFNRNAKFSRVRCYVITGKLAENDEAVTRAMKAEVADILRQIETGITELSADKIREACKKAKALEDMLSDDAKKKLADAVKESRRLARKLGEVGNVAAIKLDAAAREINAAKTCFVDLDETEIQIPTVAAETRNLDLSPDMFDADTSTNKPIPVDVPSIDF